MKFYTLDPLLDSRWDDLVATHPRASVFHHSGWLGALAKTYGYRAVTWTTTPPGRPLSDGLVFCEVRSWITGNRLVSLPFSDHADPLVMDDNIFELQESLLEGFSANRWRYFELRPTCGQPHPYSRLATTQSFWLHILDLAPSCEQLFSNLHRSCMQRRVRHAEREQLCYEKGCSEKTLDDFYRLLMMTRRRHRLLPQPRVWFSNLLSGMGRKVEIRLARKDDVPLAAILTLRHRNTVVYKYGCSDERYHSLGAMPFLFWRLIEESKSDGAEEIDLGRTEVENQGLTEFKDHLGASRSRLVYLRYPPGAATTRVSDIMPATPRALFSALPDMLSSRMGRMVYRHIG